MMWWALWCAAMVAGSSICTAAPAPDSLQPLDLVQMDPSSADDGRVMELRKASGMQCSRWAGTTRRPRPGSICSPICHVMHRDWRRSAKGALGPSARCRRCRSTTRWRCCDNGSCSRWPASRCARPTSGRPWPTASSCRTLASEVSGPTPLPLATTTRVFRSWPLFFSLSAVLTTWLEARSYVNKLDTFNFGLPLY